VIIDQIMKKVLFILFVAFQSAYAQKEAAAFKSKQLSNPGLLSNELKSTFLNSDFSSLFITTENKYVYGFIGDTYERIRVKIISVSKSRSSPNTYEVYGKSMVKTNVDQFHGTLKITNIRKLKVLSNELDEKLKGNRLKGRFVILGDYFFSEPRDEKHSGTFKGAFKTNFYLDKNGKHHYDDVEIHSDSYTNNQFAGVWASYDGKILQRCNWGDYRIPNSGDLDVGAGDFSPAGWDNNLKQDKWWR